MPFHKSLPFPGIKNKTKKTKRNMLSQLPLGWLHLSSKHEALSSGPSTEKTKQLGHQRLALGQGGED
jgi:hypothetical protein